MPRGGSRYVAAGAALCSLALAAGCGGGSAPPDTGSMVTLAERWYAQADPSVCSELTEGLLESGFGKKGAQGRQACRAALEKAKPVQLVTVDQPVVDGDKATLKVSYTIDGKRHADQLDFVLVDGHWLADDVVAGQTPEPPPATTQGSTAPAQPPAATTSQQTSTALVSPTAQLFANVAPVGTSKEHGSAVLRGTPDGKTVAVVFMTLEHRHRAPQAVELVRGTCDSPGPLLYRLADVRAPSGVSSRTLGVAFGSFRKSRVAVVVHRSGAGSPIVACGDLSDR